METLRYLIVGLPIAFLGLMTVDFVIGLFLYFRNGIPSLASLAPSHPLAEPVNPSAVPKTRVSHPLSVAQNEGQTSDVVLNVFRGLTKRELRKILSPLGIQQKRNGVEITTEMAVAQVTRIYKEDSARVIAVIRQKLPDKQLSREASVAAPTVT
jgi:hypothetical protein